MKNPKSFEEAYNRLCQINEEVNSPETKLSDAVKLFEEAAALSEFCKTTLEQSKVKISEITEHYQVSGGNE